MIVGKTNKIIAIDPGYDRCGVAIVSEENNKPLVLYSACVTSTKTDEQYLRLTSIFKQLETLINKHKPSHLVIETLFFSVNKKTAIRVAEARGAILTLAGLHGLSLVELSPQAIKIAMTGTGNATKNQIEKMVRLTVVLPKNAKLDDEIDAIALGVAGIQKIKFENREKALAK